MWVNCNFVVGALRIGSTCIATGVFRQRGIPTWMGISLPAIMYVYGEMLPSGVLLGKLDTDCLVAELCNKPVWLNYAIIQYHLHVKFFLYICI